jgi:hypothetical protein
MDGKTVDSMRTGGLQLVRKVSGLTEDRLAARLGISRDWLAALSFRLWNKPFGEKRDEIAGPDANKQKRGQATRTTGRTRESVSRWRRLVSIKAPAAQRFTACPPCSNGFRP